MTMHPLATAVAVARAKVAAAAAAAATAAVWSVHLLLKNPHTTFLPFFPLSADAPPPRRTLARPAQRRQLAGLAPRAPRITTTRLEDADIVGFSPSRRTAAREGAR